MAKVLKGMVSKNKRRHQEDGFNLDLTYICPNIIAMGYPAEKWEGVYRNNIDDVCRSHHLMTSVSCLPTHLLIVAEYPFDDHNPPKLGLIPTFCADMDNWLGQNSQNVAAIHCKAGKGRAGLMICAYLLHNRRFSSALEALDFYAQARTHDKKGVTIPSQRRYVHYYSYLVTHNATYEARPVLLHRICFHTLPMFSSGNCAPSFVVYKEHLKLLTWEGTVQRENADREGERNRGRDCMQFLCHLQSPLPLCDDVKFALFFVHLKEKMFQFWINTFFLHTNVSWPLPPPPKPHGPATSPAAGGPGELACEGEYVTLTLAKADLDKANKDKANRYFSPNFKVKLYFTEGSELPPRHSQAPAKGDREGEGGESCIWDNSTQEEDYNYSDSSDSDPGTNDDDVVKV
uniref:Phosphatidylinositol 3,4,5-trisphosphate 3-phosphatase and dual-specificity protein phosphatase PTEN n=1 Tax=Eptatretus burgeri TaxID=7764 RepID=A0A8C4R5K9_EPTBU